MDILELQNLITNLNDKVQFDTLVEEAEALSQEGEVSERVDFVGYLSDLFMRYGDDIAKSDPKKYDQLQTYWVLLSFGAFVGFGQPDQDSLLQKRIFFAIQRGYDPDDLVRQFFQIFDSDEFISEHFRDYIKDLEQNVEKFGSFPIEVEGKKYVPEIRYWILDYSKYPSKVSKRTAVERLNYINQSPNTRQLTQNQRQVLLQLFKLYDNFINAERPLNYSHPQKAVTIQLPVQSEPLYPLPPSDIPLQTPSPAHVGLEWAQQQPGARQFRPIVPVAQVPPQPQTQSQQQAQPQPKAPQPPKIDIESKLDDLKNRLNK